MVMQMVQAGGVEAVEDGRRSADIDNPKGYFEDERVKDLGEHADPSWLRHTRGKAIKIISYLLKDLPPSNNYKVILVERDLQEVLASQNKMLERRGETNPVSDDKMADNYQSLMIRVNYLLRKAPHFEALRVRYDDVVADPRRQAAAINAFLGGGLDVERMASTVDPSLYRNRAETSDAAPSGPPAG